MDIRKIIREEVNDFDWVDGINPYQYALTDDEWVELNREMVPLLANEHLRTGQSYMIALQKVNPFLYNYITGKDIDPFSNDDKVINFIRFLNGDNDLTESIKLPVEVGDTVFMGKFKNKKTVIKTIEWNEKGDLMINGKPALKMRIPKKAKKVVKESEFDWAENIKIFDEQVPEDWIGKSFGYGGVLKEKFGEGNLDAEEIFTIDGVDENGNLVLSKFHPEFGVSRDIGSSPHVLRTYINSGNWVWV
tara:strand:- start:1777 stop:2517 length:741 start_codon:yes stop_codon:yes gene_type:complete